jgi:hypothetical protein
MVYQLVICTRTNWPMPGTRRSGRVSPPVDAGACDAPHAADPRQAIRLARGGRGGLAYRLDLLCAKGRLVSSRAIFSRKSSIAMVDSPGFSRKRPSSWSRLSSGWFSSPPGQQRGTPHARSRDGQQGFRSQGTAGRALRPAADVTRPRSAAVQKTARVSSAYSCSPLQSLYELRARGPREKSLVYASGHLL